jgi:hypothetical protein
MPVSAKAAVPATDGTLSVAIAGRTGSLRRLKSPCPVGRGGTALNESPMPNVCMGNAASGGGDDTTTAACAIAQIHVPPLALARFSSVADRDAELVLLLPRPIAEKQKRPLGRELPAGGRVFLRAELRHEATYDRAG